MELHHRTFLINREQSIFNFFQDEIVPVFNHIKNLDKD